MHPKDAEGGIANSVDPDQTAPLSENLGTLRYPKTERVAFYNRVFGPRDADGIANSADPDQTALGLHCLPRC